MRHTSILAPILLGFLLVLGVPELGFACDVDADCGVGGTCIKREKRARGVCYGRRIEEAVGEPSSGPVQPQFLEGEKRGRAEAWLGDPEQILKQNLPGKTLGTACMVNQDCPEGSECVIAGFEGRCVEL